MNIDDIRTQLKRQIKKDLHQQLYCIREGDRVAQSAGCESLFIGYRSLAAGTATSIARLKRYVNMSDKELNDEYDTRLADIFSLDADRMSDIEKLEIDYADSSTQKLPCKKSNKPADDQSIAMMTLIEEQLPAMRKELHFAEDQIIELEKQIRLGYVQLERSEALLREYKEE